MKPLLASVLLCTALAVSVAEAHAQTSAPKIDVQAQSPADTDADLQVICLFRSSPRNPLKGALTELDEKTKGLLSSIRQPNRFHGELGETLLVALPSGTLKAKRLLLIGLGDSQTFTADRMRLIGVILCRESASLTVAHPYFAPTVKDGGVDRFTTGEIAEQVIGGFLEAYATDQYLTQQGESLGHAPTQLTYLAGKAYQASTQGGIDKAVAAFAK